MQMRTDSTRVWPTILGVGGLCWLVATSIETMWLWPVNMRTAGGVYIVSPEGRMVARVAGFLFAALGYRIALALAWPQRLGARMGVLLVNVLLGALEVRISMLAINLVVAYIDHRADVMRDDLGASHMLDADWSNWLGVARFILPVYYLGLAAVALVVLARRFRQNSLRMTQLSLDYANARIAMLSAQLQPHFLFNSLHAISELVNVSPARATDVIARLGDFLRHALESSKQPWLSVRNEVAGLQAYLAVQRARFREELEVSVQVAPDALVLTIPAMLLQPLAENAIEHGRRHGDGTLQVHIELRRAADQLQVRVINSRPTLPGPLPRSAFGNGLTNVNARLHAAYGDAATLHVGPAPGGGTVTAIDLPAMLAPPDPATNITPNITHE